MKKNTITIDLEKLQIGVETAYTIQEIKQAQVPERCTLTEAVEKFGVKLYLKSGDRLKNLFTPEDVDQFKSQYLDKEETLEDGIYEAKYIDTVMLHYIKDGRAYSTRDMTKGIPATDLINPVKIAEI